MRQPYQILVFPFVKEKDGYYYAIFRREDLGVWQGLAGGGEEEEEPLAAAKRESWEEASIDKNLEYIRLSAISTVPAARICGLKWGEEIVMIPEFAFGVEAPSKQMVEVRDEHLECQWLSHKKAVEELEWDSNKSALWELNYRLNVGSISSIKKNIEAIKKFL